MRRIGAVVVAAMLGLALAAPAHAATFNVDSTADEPDANTGLAACATAAGDCTLRAAIDQANADSSDSTINLASGTYTLTGANDEDSNASGDLDVLSRGFQVTIAGAGARTTVIDGGGLDRVLHVLVRSKLAVRGVTITGGLANDDLSDGGGIYMDGGSTETALTVVDSTIRGNRAANFLMGLLDGDGGGIHTGENSQVSITGTTITGNEASDDGGGIENDAASLSIVNSTIHANTALGDTAADPEGNGGGIEHNEGQLSLVHTTITDNVAAHRGGGVNVEPGSAGGPRRHTPQHDPVRHEAPTEGLNCRVAGPATLTSAGTNLESGTDCGFVAAGNVQNANPQLGALGNNGGQTDTRALGQTSPALDRATSAPCPATDQRGTTRPQGPACDIGAFERTVLADLAVTIDDSPDPVAAGANLTYRIVARNGRPDAATGARVGVDLPSGVDLQTSTIEGGGSCTGSSTLTCTVGSLSVGQAREVTVVVTTASASAQSSGGTLDAVATVSATEADPIGSNNEARAQTAIEEDNDKEGDDKDGDDKDGDEEPGRSDGPDGAETAGESGSGEDLPFTGFPLAMVIVAGACMVGAGLMLRRRARFVD